MNRAALLLSLLLAPLPAAPVAARPPYRKALVDLLGLPNASRLNDCRTCHLPLAPGADESDRPHNPFGARLKSVRSELKKAGRPFDITARLLAVAEEDSDGDGVANLLELLAGSFPGDKMDKPGDAALAAAARKKETFLASLHGYRWRPFDRPVRPAVPVVNKPAAAGNPIDRFLAVQLQKRKLVPRPEAPRAVLLRRVSIDLTGLPPTPEELRAFLADASPLAYERVVDRLLASPRYGERWGRHWMDVWRYSDWAGYGAQVRDSLPHVWHWRDWIVESLNADKPYDRMVQEMLAADELTPTDPDALRATGYLVRNYKLLSREKWLQDAVDHTAQGFLGVTLGCARCHDHMYDPITQKEYYQVRAVFAPHNVRTDRLPGWPDVARNGLPRAFDAEPNALTHLFLRGDDRTPDKTHLAPGVPEALGGTFRVAPVPLPREAYSPDTRPFVIREDLAAGARATAQARAALQQSSRSRALAAASVPAANPLLAVARLAGWEQARERFESAQLVLARQVALEAVLRVEALGPAGAKPSEAWQAAAKAAVRAQRKAAVLEARRAVTLAARAERNASAANRDMLSRQLTQARDRLLQAMKALEAPDSTAYAPRAVKTWPAVSTGRRLAFARWLTSRDNPLAARVAVNHVWLRHFGQGLAPSVFDFGRNGQPPTHPALLDWLAVEFMDRGWSMKHLHRLMTTSEAYKRASTPAPEDLARDPDNTWLWRCTPRRVEAEVVRDSIFFVARRLDPTMGGPDIPHQQGLTVPRRSLYFQHAAEKQMELLSIFDAPSVSECYRRKQAILPQQALALVNSELTWRHARLTARALAREAPGAAGFTKAAFEAVLSRAPTPLEQKECVSFLAATQARFAAGPPGGGAPDLEGDRPASDPAMRARENLVGVLLNHHEFVTIR
jgi:hypothetical protein